MYHHPRDIIGITVTPNIRMLKIIQNITQDICAQCGLEQDKITKVTLAVEEVFSYCVKLVQTEKTPSRITITYRREQTALQIIIEHQGPRGLLEKHFLLGQKESMLLTTFEAIGMHIAHDLLDDLRYVRLFDGTNRFTVTINTPPKNLSQ